MMDRQSKTDEPADAGKQSSAVTGMPPGADGGFAGELKKIQLDNLIQLYCLSAETIAIKVYQDNYTGTVYLEKGEVIHAVSGPRSGEEAFYTIMALQGGRIETSEAEKADQQTIHKNYQFLLMEAARLSDESGWMDENEDADVPEAGPVEGTVEVGEQKLKAMVVDDSKFMRKIITSMLTAEGDIEVVGTANDGRQALQLLGQIHPDFITLDANMPVMDGPTTLKHIMIKKPCPVIIMSNLASGDEDRLTHFFDLGAVDFLPKPVKNKNMLVQQQQILSRARSAAKACILNFKRHQPAKVPDSVLQEAAPSNSAYLVVFISGLGGYHEMLYILSTLPGGSKSYFAAFQSLPQEFTGSFAMSAGKQSSLRTVAVDSKRSLEEGCCYIASLESHVLLQKNDDGYCLVPDDTSYSRTGKLRNMDDFINSVVESFAGVVHAVVLSGAEDISVGSLESIQKKSGRIIVQDPASCMMPHLPEELIDKRVADSIVTPEKVIGEVLAITSGPTG